MVDSIFLSRLGEEAISAISLSFVVQNLAIALFSGIATGINAEVSKALGENNRKKIRRTIASGFCIQFLIVLAFIGFGVWGVPRYYDLSTNNSKVIEMGVSYLRPCLLFSAFSGLQISAEKLLQSTGKSKLMLYSQLLGTLVNYILDPILIFGLLGFPALGVKGAAIATLIGQGSAGLLALLFNIKGNRILFDKTDNKGWISWKSLKRILLIGVPTATIGIAGSIGNYGINRILIGFFNTANAAFGIYTKLQSVALMPTQGFGAGLITMFAFFYGQRNMGRIIKSLKAGVTCVGIWSAICTLVFVLFPRLLLKPFSPTLPMLEVGIPAFRIIGTTYFVSGYMLVLNSFFQAIGKSFFSFIISVSRQILVRIPVALWLATLDKINLIWWSWPISEVVSDIVCVAFFFYACNQLSIQLQPQNLVKV